MNPYNSLCDDFGVYTYVNTKMPLPAGRETVLHFFDGLRKTYPQMTDFDTREGGEFVLEEDREQGSYRWVTLEQRRLCAGYVNPPELEDADALHEHVLEVAPFHLDFNPLDCEALDVLFAFDFMFTRQPRRGGGRGARPEHDARIPAADAGRRASSTTSRR